MSIERQKLINLYQNMQDHVREAIERDPQGFTLRIAKEFKGSNNDSFLDGLKSFQHEMHGALALTEQMKRAQTVVFSTEQAVVFKDVTKDYTDELDYRLPFPYTFLQFTRPLPVDVPMANRTIADHIAYVMLAQVEIDEEQCDRWRQESEKPYILIGVADNLKPGVLNNVTVIYADNNTTRFGWISNDHNELTVNGEGQVYDYWTEIKKLCIACIGYINCENIYLEKQGEVPEAVNRKRESKGKSRLEPYYVCRIRGVQYDSTNATGAGNKHGIRYDVRGHFRRLPTGKTLWVRPHQRGLKNELYIPKVYKINEGSKPEWTTQ